MMTIDEEGGSLGGGQNGHFYDVIGERSLAKCFKIIFCPGISKNGDFANCDRNFH